MHVHVHEEKGLEESTTTPHHDSGSRHFFTAEPRAPCFNMRMCMHSQVRDKAQALFGSGWVWVIVQDGKLKVVSTPNQDNPLMAQVSDSCCEAGMKVNHHYAREL